MNVRLSDSSARLGVLSSWSCLRRRTWRQATPATLILVAGVLVLATGPDVLAQQPYGGNVAYRPAAITGLGLMGQAASNPCNYNWGYSSPFSYNRSCAPYGLPGTGASL